MIKSRLDKNDSRRGIRSDIHLATGCFFTNEELERLKKIKSDPDWIPASMRQPSKFGRGALTISKRMLAIYRREFDRITQEDRS